MPGEQAQKFDCENQKPCYNFALSWIEIEPRKTPGATVKWEDFFGRNHLKSPDLDE
jgi:hypothetical protein